MRSLDTAPTRHHPRQGPASGDVVLHHQRPPAVPLQQAWVASTEITRGHQRSPEVTWQASPRRPLVLALLSSSPRAHSSLVSPSLVTRSG